VRLSDIEKKCLGVVTVQWECEFGTESCTISGYIGVVYDVVMCARHNQC